MKILVTGGTGRVGANLVKLLLKEGHTIRTLLYPGDAGRAGKLDTYEEVEAVEGDLRDLEDVKNAVRGVDAIYHLAAAFGGPFDNHQYLAINGSGTLNLLESVKEMCPNLHRFVYACTEAIYWRLEDRSPNIQGRESRYFPNPITEDMVARYHQMPYFLTKWIGEQLAMTYYFQFQVPVTSFRFSTIIEPSEFLNKEGLPKLFLFNTTWENYQHQHSPEPAEQEMLEEIRALHTGEDKFLLSLNPNRVPFRQQYCDVRDIAKGLSLAIETDQAIGQEFNLGGAAIFDWAEVVPFLSQKFGLPFVEARIPSPNYFELDMSKTRNLLGFNPLHDLNSILETAEAMRHRGTTDVIPTGKRFESSP